MPTLCVLRHAKSERTLPIDDHDRPLGPRGYRAAPLVGAWLREHGLSPRLVLCSSARRARDTLEGLGELGNPETVVSQDLYLAPAEQWLTQLHAVHEGTSPVLVVGHSPGLHDLAVDLAGSGGDLRLLASSFPTAALAVLSFGGRWSDLARGSAHLAAFVRPRDLARGAAQDEGPAAHG